MQSRKAKRYKACVAQTPEEAPVVVTALLALPARSRGRIILCELLPLRNAGCMPAGFPMGREFRVFVYRDAIVGIGYYWETDPQGLDALPDPERSMVQALARETARRIGTPYVAIDIGQLESGE